MAVITGLTAAKILEVIDEELGNPILEASVSNNQLHLGFRDETTLDFPLDDPDAMVFKGSWDPARQYKRGQVVIGSDNRVYFASGADPLVGDNPTIAGGSGNIFEPFTVGAYPGSNPWTVSGYGSVVAGADGAGYWQCGSFPYGGREWINQIFSNDVLLTAEMKGSSPQNQFIGWGVSGGPDVNNVAVSFVNSGATHVMRIVHDINGTFGAGVVFTELVSVPFTPGDVVQWVRLERIGRKFRATAYSSDPNIDPAAVVLATCITADLPLGDAMLGPVKPIIGQYFDGGQTTFRSFTARAALAPGDWVPITPAPSTVAAGPWTDITLINGWTYFGSDGAGVAPYSKPQYRINGDKVEFRGMLSTGNGSPPSSTTFCTLPVGARPPHTRILPMYRLGSGMIRSDINTGGSWNADVTTIGQLYTLDDIFFSITA